MITALKAICQKGGVMLKKIIKKDNNHIKTERCFFMSIKNIPEFFSKWAGRHISTTLMMF